MLKHQNRWELLFIRRWDLIWDTSSSLLENSFQWSFDGLDQVLSPKETESTCKGRTEMQITKLWGSEWSISVLHVASVYDLYLPYPHTHRGERQVVELFRRRHLKQGSEMSRTWCGQWAWTACRLWERQGLLWWRWTGSKRLRWRR